MPSPDCPYVSRGGVKLAAALEAFGIDVTGLVCADLGCSTGGFVDCLLQGGAARVYAVDTAYGQLAWSLRNDQRVIVYERTNALHAQPGEPCDLVTVDLGWTRQDKAIPAAMRWLKPGGQSRIITLIKPHYEQPRPAGKRGRGRGKALDDAIAAQVARRVLAAMPTWGVQVLGHIPSPIRGGKGGNLEYLALLGVAR